MKRISSETLSQDYPHCESHEYILKLSLIMHCVNPDMHFESQVNPGRNLQRRKATLNPVKNVQEFVQSFFEAKV